MDWRYNTIWFEQIQPEKQLTWDFKENKHSILDLWGIEYAILWYFRYKGLSFELLPNSDKLCYLEMNLANIKDFCGIERFTNLKRLELHYCKKLENIIGLLGLRDSIEWLYISHSKKIRSTDEISHLANLKVLRLNNCGPLESLDFLKDLPNLIDFRFVDTNILDGDLTPLIKHPNLRSAGFFNKRHFNLSEEKVDLILKEKST
jgi:hypothetical protein